MQHEHQTPPYVSDIYHIFCILRAASETPAAFYAISSLRSPFKRRSYLRFQFLTMLAKRRKPFSIVRSMPEDDSESMAHPPPNLVPPLPTLHGTRAHFENHFFSIGDESGAVASEKRGIDSDDLDDGGFFWDSSPRRSRNSDEDDEDEDGYKSNLNYDDFDL